MKMCCNHNLTLYNQNIFYQIRPNSKILTEKGRFEVMLQNNVPLFNLL